MTETAFPALARAKKLFLLRQQTARRRGGVFNVESKAVRRLDGTVVETGEMKVRTGSDAGRRCTAALVAFCKDFDEQLKLVNSDVLLLRASVRREYQREALALERLTSELLDRRVDGLEAAKEVKRCRVRLRARRPCIKLRVVLQTPLKAPAVMTPPTSPKTLSRTAQLAHQAVKACVLQAMNSVETLDGYVSKGRALSSSMPRDHAMLQDFAAYLELRLKSQNLVMLRRIFADFLNDQEDTLKPMMQRGFPIITVLPILRTSARRRHQAAKILAKPKFHLESGCVFFYLQYRAATRNMALLRHMFLEFLAGQETALLEFAAKGSQVISVIPFELPQLRLSMPPPQVQSETTCPASESVDQAEMQQSVPAESEGLRVNAVNGAGTADDETNQDNDDPVASRAVVQESMPSKGGQKRKPTSSDRGAGDQDKQTTEKSSKRGKPVMSEEMCRSQLELTEKMKHFEEQIPWEVVYSNLPAPFDEQGHPMLARKYRKFWRKHSRAVWERDFWPPMSRKLNLEDCNKRNNRQLTAKNAFESLIISMHEELGAEFFVNLDKQKPLHPGWWYRGPVVALFALQQLKGEDAVWDYVRTEALERFPDCKMPLPLKAPNSSAVQRCHVRESVSMWMTNHRLTPTILCEISALKKEQQEHELKASEEPEPEVEPENSISVQWRREYSQRRDWIDPVMWMVSFDDN
ncbi:unnamed protein product [Phytophthora lilii]|uniref:Unnamed protein product n=1 Tax=Phytophthora lilii TaxID=2077276 RepID=A0A9W7CQG7_9STRA|nr:unnamed protein product [Phytophthora lilii]